MSGTRTTVTADLSAKKTILGTVSFQGITSLSTAINWLMEAPHLNAFNGGKLAVELRIEETGSQGVVELIRFSRPPPPGETSVLMGRDMAYILRIGKPEADTSAPRDTDARP